MRHQLDSFAVKHVVQSEFNGNHRQVQFKVKTFLSIRYLCNHTGRFTRGKYVDLRVMQLKSLSQQGVIISIPALQGTQEKYDTTKQNEIIKIRRRKVSGNLCYPSTPKPTLLTLQSFIFIGRAYCINIYRFYIMRIFVCKQILLYSTRVVMRSIESDTNIIFVLHLEQNSAYFPEMKI